MSDAQVLADDDAERCLRHARQLVEQAMPTYADMPRISAALEACRQVLGQLAGDYRRGEQLSVAEGEPRRPAILTP